MPKEGLPIADAVPNGVAPTSESNPLRHKG
jgi:hypothetical protein